MRTNCLTAAIASLLLAFSPITHAQRASGHAATPQAEATIAFRSPSSSGASVLERRLSPLRMQAPVAKATGSARRLLGTNRPLDASQAIASPQLTWQRLQDGSAVARLRIVSPEALALRVAFTFAPGAEGIEARFRGSAEGAQVAGPLRASDASARRGNAWGPVVFGDAVEVEVVLPPSLDVQREWFAVREISHLFVDPMRAKDIGSAGSCERDVKCYALSDTARSNARATTLMFVTGSAGTFGCTGTLMNTDPFSGTPYVMTWSSCVENDAEAATVNTLWEYEATSCGSNAAQAFTRRTGGAALLARNEAKQYAFLRLNENVPANSWYSGWDPTDPPSGTAVLAVHHPKSDLKKLSQGRVSGAGKPITVQFSSGVTEDASVGSGIFTGEQYLAGVLYAGDSSCSNPSGLDDYWPLSDMWGELKGWLRPASSATPVTGNLSDIWWNPGESGWGLTIADHETQIFAVWYTYRQDGSPTWFVIPGGTFSQGRRIFTGNMYQTTGPAYNGPFNPSFVNVQQVGSITIDFAPPALAAGNALFTYNVGNVARTVQIQRQSFGDSPPDWTNDITDIWWDPSESGWGMTLAQHGNNIFGVWYTYDTNGQPLFVVMPGVSFTGATSFTGTLYTTTGPYYGNPTFDSSLVRVTAAGSASFGFDSFMGPNGSKRGTFNASFRGTQIVKHISGQPFGNPAPANPANTAAPKMQLVVGTAGSGTGSVVSAPGGINCGAQCVASFVKGTSVTLTATPGNGSRFVSFTGTCSTPATSCSLVMSANAAVTATFEKLAPPSNLAINILQLPNATAGVFYSQPVATATGGSPPYHYQSDTFANGTPPPGMVVTLEGNLQGTPSTTITVATAYNFGVCVVDLAATSRCAPAAITVGPAQPVNNGTIKWQIGDQCNNGQEVWYKFFDRAHNWVWPSATTHYAITSGQQINNSLACQQGALVCLGARSADGALSWGVGFDDSSGCPNCCGTCDGKTYAYTFGCNSPPPPGGAGQCTGLQGGPRACQPCNSDADCGGNVCWTGAKPAPFCGG